MTAPADSGLVGQMIADRYLIEKKLGGGGMGEVYLAQHVRIKRRCAIKVLRAALTGDDDSLRRFQKEAENASLINHPNVAQMYDFGEHGNLLYLAMEFIEGQSMQQVMEKDGVMHPDMVADVIMQSASALDAAHAQQVLHRDVKPDNIMLARNTDGTYLVKLVDFGIARAMASTDKRVTQTGMVVGTPEFMSPEQIAGEPLDARSDLYSLALVAFIALTGTGAFPDSGSMESLILRLTSRPRTLIEARNGVSWPPKLQTVFDRALAPQREERQNSAVEFAAQLSDSIIQMSPSETSAFYRRALEARAVNPVALTPSATPVKPAKGNKRGKTEEATAVNPPAPEYRPATMVGRPTQVAYNGPAMRKNRTWNIFVGLVVLGGIYVVATHQTDAVIEKVKVWFQPAKTFIDAGMGAVNGAKSADSAPAAAPDAPKATKKTKQPVKSDSSKTRKDTAAPKSSTPSTDTTSTYGF
ncbi:MAG: serine/threonine-protein kinase [Gemmatimonadaceae bacterium]